MEWPFDSSSTCQYAAVRQKDVLSGWAWRDFSFACV